MTANRVDSLPEMETSGWLYSSAASARNTMPIHSKCLRLSFIDPQKFQFDDRLAQEFLAGLLRRGQFGQQRLECPVDGVALEAELFQRERRLVRGGDGGRGLSGRRGKPCRFRRR